MRVTTSENVGIGSGIPMPENFKTTRSESFNPRVEKSPVPTDRLTHPLTLIRQPRTEPYAHLFRADCPRNRTSDLKHEPRAVPHRAAVPIRPRVGVRLHKLVREEPVRSVDLDAIEPSV